MKTTDIVNTFVSECKILFDMAKASVGKPISFTTYASKELTRVIDGVKEDMFSSMNAHRCEECEGTGAQSTPSSYYPCGQCDGTGFDLQMGSFNDIKNSILKDLGK
tara:strand:- start:1196 stop:1513 length:318 start_codon:yes stop_codon:yes gene_type:complete